MIPRLITAALATVILASAPAAPVAAPSSSPSMEGRAHGSSLAYTLGSCCWPSLSRLVIREPGGRSRVVAEMQESIDGAPAWSPDGSRLAIAMHEIAQTPVGPSRVVVGSIKMIRAARGDQVEFARMPGRVVGQVAWSSSGWLSYSAWVPTGYMYGYPPGVPVLWLARDDGSLTVPVASGGAAAWSKDGSKLAFIGNDRGVYVATVDAIGPTSIQRVSPPSVLGRGVSWAPDGRRLAFVGSPPSDVFDEHNPIWIVEADGARARMLPARTAYAPSWSPDGRWLAYTGRSLRKVSADGRRDQLIARSAYGPPAWAPDGRWIAFASARGDWSATRLQLVRPDGRERRTVALTGNWPGFTWSE